MTKQQLVKSEHTLTVAEGEKLDYYKFQDQAILKVLKGDVILWVCTEKMDVWARIEFEKLKEDTRAYIVAEIIKQKKDDKTYMYYDQEDDKS